PVDVRTITATHGKLAVLSDAGRFRQDLLARLAGYSVELPSLHARRLDLGNICATLLPRFALPGSAPRLTRQAVRALIAYDWPHNIRGLAKALETGLVLGGGEIDLVHLPPDVRASTRSALPGEAALRNRSAVWSTAHGAAPAALLTANQTQHRDQLV